MKKKILALVLLVFLLSGCAATLKALEYGKEGYDTPIATTTRTAVTAAATPLLGGPLAALAGGIISAAVGAFAMWKRQKWLDTPTNK